MASTFEKQLKKLRESEVYDIEALRDDISEAINTAMQDRNISKAQLARKLRTSRAYITQILQGNTNFTVESLVKIARALGGKFEVKLSLASARNEDAPS